MSLTWADLNGADLTGARWPAAEPVPEGWMTDGESGRPEPAGQLPEVIAAAGPPGRGQPDQLPVRRRGSPAEIPGQFGQRILHGSPPRPPWPR
jgi:hypothetical protein